MLKITPPIDKLIVKLIVKEETTASGIILGGESINEEHPHDILLGEVVAAGIESKFVELGNIILFEQCFSRPLNLGMVMKVEYDYKTIREQDIIGVRQCQEQKSIEKKSQKEVKNKVKPDSKKS